MVWLYKVIYIWVGYIEECLKLLEENEEVREMMYMDLVFVIRLMLLIRVNFNFFWVLSYFVFFIGEIIDILVCFFYKRWD